MSTNKRGITFVGAMTMMFTLIFFHDFFMINMSTRHVLMVFVYIVIGLATDSHKGIAQLVQRVWYITQNGDTEEEKFQLIKSFIEINVNKWSKYWEMYQTVVEGEKGNNFFKRYLLKIPKGTLSLIQYCWIIAYIVYGIFSTATFAHGMTEPINFLIDLGGITFFVYTGSRIIGIGDFMVNIFESMKREKDVTIKHNLRLLESEIIFGARHYGFLKGKLDLKKSEYNGI